METFLQSTSLIKRAYWLVNLRWIAILVLGGATFFASSILGVSLPVLALYLLGCLLILYNLLLFFLLNHFTRTARENALGRVSKIITFQISADLFILTAILHYSGGIENPFFFYFVFHMIIASILLPRRMSYLQATLAVSLFGSLVLLEYLEVIGHYSLAGFVVRDMHRDGFFVLGTFLIFSTTLYLVVYMTTSIVVQLRKQQASYAQANIQLREKDQVKNEYVLRLTHDIRGHLAAIQSCLNIVRSRIVGPLNERQADLVQRAHRRVGKCAAFVTALLKLTKMKLKGKFEMRDFSIKNAIFNAVAAAENDAASKSIKIGCNIEPSVDEIYGEPILIEETITNLVQNAVRYTPEKGTVTLNAKDQGDSVVVQVCDTGIGIPEDELGKIFDEFYRSGNARKVERDGTGLGLSIAKQAVERHGGEIWAQNNASGGSTFSFTLPKGGGIPSTI